MYSSAIVAVVVAAINRVKDYDQRQLRVQSNNLGLKQYVEQYRRVDVKLPRYSGHSTAARELMNLYDAVLITRGHCLKQMAERCLNPDSHIIHLYEVSEGALRGRTHELVIVDDASQCSHQEIERIIAEAYVYDPMFAFLN